MAGTNDLPREKLEKKGARALSDEELLMIIIGSGCRGSDYKAIAKKLHEVIKKNGVDEVCITKIKEIKGIGTVKAATIFAFIEYFRRHYGKNLSPLIDSPAAAAEQLYHIRNKKQEHFVLLTLDGGRRLIENRIISIGTLNAALIHPREVFVHAIEDRAASIIVAHNHPGKTLQPSSQDRHVTKVLKSAGEIIGIPLDDHILIAGESYMSISDIDV